MSYNVKLVIYEEVTETHEVTLSDKDYNEFVKNGRDPYQIASFIISEDSEVDKSYGNTDYQIISEYKDGDKK
jgi:hypothetical protein